LITSYFGEGVATIFLFKEHLSFQELITERNMKQRIKNKNRMSKVTITEESISGFHVENILFFCH
jgi:hypothetical protein